MFMYRNFYNITKRRRLLILLIPLSLSANADSNINLDSSVRIVAEKIDYDRNSEKFTATGKVELYEGEKLLIADKLVYLKNHDTAKAIGNVMMLDEKGNVAFADELNLSEKMTKGIIQNLKIRMTNSGKFASKTAIRVDKDTIILKNTLYSACKINDHKYPLWQLRSDKTTIDDKKEVVVHENAKMEVLGIPIIYTPYFSHPTAKAGRKTGFLVPGYFTDLSFGAGINLPFYYNIHPQADNTSVLTIYAKNNPLFRNEFRFLTEYGMFWSETSITKPKHEPGFPNRKFKGHMYLKWNRSFENDWKFESNYRRTYDKTFLKKYNLDPGRSYLTSDISLERYKDSDFTSIKSMKYQDLRSNFNDMPVIIPFIEGSIHRNSEYKYFEDVDFYMNYNILSLDRKQNSEMQRISTIFGVKSGYITNNGLVLSYDNNLRIDGYHSKRVMYLGRRYDKDKIRVNPSSAVNLKYPMYNKNIIISPIINTVYSPYRNPELYLPNEDSTDIEYSDNSLFSSNRFAGIDRFEKGFRLNYGIEATANFDVQKTYLAFGQTYKPKIDPEIPDVSGLNNKKSDYVGAVGFKFSDNIRTLYRFRLNNNNFAMNSNEINTIYTNGSMNLNLAYFLVDQKSTPSLRKQKALLLGGNYMFNDDVSIFGNATKLLTSRKITNDRGFVDINGGIKYKKDCIDFALTGQRNFNRDRDVLPSMNYMIHLSLKTLN